jgi:hypothetical protein
MHAQNTKEQEPVRKRKKSRKLLRTLAIAAGLIVLLMLALPPMVSSSGGTAFLLGRINRSLDGTLGMEDLSFGWLSGVKIKNLSFADSAGQMQIRVDSISLRPKLLGLLAGNIVLADAVIERPDVLLTVPQGKPSAAEPKTVTATPKEAVEYKIGPIDLQVRQGHAVIEQVQPAGQPLRLEVRNFASTVQLDKPGRPSSLDVSMNLADGGRESTISAKGAVTTASRTWGLEGLSGQLEMEVDSLSLASLTPLLALAGKEVEMAGTLNAKADVKLAGGQIEMLDATADLTGFEQEIGGKRTRLEQPVKAVAKISTQGGNVLIDALSVESTFFHLDGKGGLNALDYTLTADLAQTQEVAGSLVDFGGYAMKGAFSGTGKVVREGDKIKTTGRHEIRDFSLRQGEKTLTLASLNQTYDIAVDTAASAATITETTITADPGRIQITGGSIGWGKPDPQVAMKLTADVNLQKARPAADFFYTLPADVSIGGQARTDLLVDMKDGKARVVTQATAIDNLRVTKKGAEPFVSKTVTLKADALMDVKNKTLLRLSGLELVSDPIRLKGQLEQAASAGQTTMSGQMDADYDLKQVTTIASPFLPEGLVLEGARQDRFEFRSQYPNNKPEEKMKNLQASGKFGFSKAQYKGLNVGPTELNLKAEKGLLAVDLSETAVNQGTLRLAGDIDLAAEPKVFRLRKPMQIIEKVQVNDELARNLLENVNPFFAGATRVSGIADFACEELVLPLGGDRKDLLRMKSVLAISQLQMRSDGFLKDLMGVLGTDMSTTMTLHPTSLVMQNDVLSYQDMQLDVGNKPVNFSGQVGPNRRLKLTMQLPWTLGGTTVRTGEKTTDRISLSIGGTIQKPEVDWGRVLQMNLGNILLREILK